MSYLPRTDQDPAFPPFQQHYPQHPKIPMHLSPLDSSTHQHSSPQPIQDHQQLPKVGQTRCCEFSEISDRSSARPLIEFLLIEDWALLSSSLHFLALDPVLSYHLQDQAIQLIDKSLLDFVHPEEQASARHDLGGVLEDRTLHGSVTRSACRYFSTYLHFTSCI